MTDTQKDRKNGLYSAFHHFRDTILFEIISFSFTAVVMDTKSDKKHVLNRFRNRVENDIFCALSVQIKEKKWLLRMSIYKAYNNDIRTPGRTYHLLINQKLFRMDLKFAQMFSLIVSLLVGKLAISLF